MRLFAMPESHALCSVGGMVWLSYNEGHGGMGIEAVNKKKFGREAREERISY